MAPVYRATAELRPKPRPRGLPRATVVDRVPADLANEVRTRQQADVAAVPVYRGPEVSSAARSRGARAFASGGAVFLPDEAGSADSPKARGLLAHELVHAVQQRTFGSRLPAPNSALGQHLEAEAQAAERFYSGEPGAAEPLPLIHAPLPAPAPESTPDLTAPAQLATQLAPAPAPTQTAPQDLHSPFDAVTTAEVGKIATESARHVVSEWTNPALQRQNAPAAGHAASGGATASPSHAGGHAATGTPGAAASTFNPAARRDELVAAALGMRNATLAAGASPITQLTDEEMHAIDRQVAAEATQHGVASTGSADTAQHYEANSAGAWMHAITGMNMNYGLGVGGYGAKVGSTESWFASETKPTRPTDQRLADQFGLINENTATQFDTDTWWGATDDKKDAGADQAAAAGTNPSAQEHESLFGRPNTDRSAVDVSKIDLDELATRIYDRLRSRLRLELLVDRERAGLLTDFR